MRKVHRWVLAGVLTVPVCMGPGPQALASPQAIKSQPAEQAASDPVRVSSQDGGRFLLRQGRTAAVLNLEGSVSGCTGTLYDDTTGERLGRSLSTHVLDEVRRAGVWYLLLQVDSGPNCNVQGQCGAGVNTDLIWLKLSPRLRVLAKQAEPVENCFTDTLLTASGGQAVNADAAGGPVELQLRGGVLALDTQTQDYVAAVQTHTTLRYDRRTPERGLLRRQTRSPLN